MPRRRTLEETLARKLGVPQTIFLLGAGASFCAGLPGVAGLTRLIRSQLRDPQKRVFEAIMQSLIDSGVENPTIEEVLSELYHHLSAMGIPSSRKKTYQVTFEEAVRCMQNALRVDVSTEYHKEFISRIVSRRNAEPADRAPPVRIFTTNYDLLIELACEDQGVVVINGYEGIFRRQWNHTSYDYDIGKATTHARNRRFEPSARHIRLYKLHGSLSWFEHNGRFYEEPRVDSEKTPLIIYPSRLKYAQSIRPPFDLLFRAFGTALDQATLLVCIGYSFADQDLNQCILPCLKSRLSLLALSREPISALVSMRAHPRVSTINETGTIINGKNRNETTDLWAFERFAKWLPAL